MNKNKKMSLSGIQIENTLSMAVQERNHRRKLVHLVIIAVFGAVGSIFTFLSMFQPQYSHGVLLCCLVLEFGFCTLLALHYEKCRPLRIILLLLYLGLLYLFRKPFASGFVSLVNTVYKVIYMTDWERFTVNPEYTEQYCITVFLILICVPILYMLCIAVLHFQNFFLGLIATLPYVEIGFYFGVAANRIFAMMLLSFWCSMASVHLANVGAYHGKGQNSFLRRDNTFFPVSSMRFMVTEKIGISVLAGVMAVCLIIQQVLNAVGYQRSDEIKTLRRDVQDYLASVMLSGKGSSSELWQGLWVKHSETDDRVVVSLGQESKREFENVSISGLTLSDLPNGRIYLKHHTGELYDGYTWRIPEDSVYNTHDVFSLFASLEYYPPEFLYPNLPGHSITMQIQQTEGIVPQCVPYAFRENEGLHFLHDNQFTAFPSVYEVAWNQDFETMLEESSQQWLSGTLYQQCRPENMDTFAPMFDYEYLPPIWMTVTGNGEVMEYPMAVEASLLCKFGYRDFVMELDTQVPDTEAMANVREAYADLLDDYDASSASAYDTLMFLQQVRETMSVQMNYTLAPGRTPANKDFVEHFLLENQRGYCMHYATAGVMLARMAGIPARYCEGYMVDCTTNASVKETEQDGTRLYTVDVLDSNAHAWAEFYLDGWGWIPFEFTYTQYEPQESSMPATEPVTSAETETSTQIQTVVMTETSVVPVEVLSETTAAIPYEPQAQGFSRTALAVIFGILGGFLAVAALIWLVYFLRILALRRRNRLFAQADRNAAARSAYAYLLRLLAYCKVDVHAQRTQAIAEEGMEKCAEYLGGLDLEPAVAAAAKAQYSPHVVTETELHVLIQTAKHLASGIYRKASVMERLKLKFILHLL